MRPTTLAQAIPENIRNIIYFVLSVLFTVELALDAFDYGLIPMKPQAAAFSVLGALGFAMASANTNVTPTPVPPPPPGDMPENYPGEFA
jgi:Mg2+/citrate symporter